MGPYVAFVDDNYHYVDRSSNLVKPVPLSGYTCGSGYHMVNRTTSGGASVYTNCGCTGGEAFYNIYGNAPYGTGKACLADNPMSAAVYWSVKGVGGSTCFSFKDPNGTDGDGTPACNIYAPVTKCASENCYMNIINNSIYSVVEPTLVQTEVRDSCQ